MSDRPLATDAFDRLASGYDAQGADKPANAHHERPATLSLLPAVSGRRILDAGCGAGHLSAELLDRGAQVVGLDSSAEMLGYASERAPAAGFVRGDLASGLPFPDGVFDGVASSLAFHYVADWVPLFAELPRVLEREGWVVCSVQHPFADFAEYEGAEDYHETERVSAMWEGFGDPVEVPAYRRPLGAMIGPALNAGFTLGDLVEAKPTDGYAAGAPERYESESTNPTFLCLRLERSG